MPFSEFGSYIYIYILGMRRGLSFGTRSCRSVFAMATWFSYGVPGTGGGGLEMDGGMEKIGLATPRILAAGWRKISRLTSGCL
jgi:hypothetical protein